MKASGPKTPPCWRRNSEIVYPIWDFENHSIFSGTYLSRPNKWVPPTRIRTHVYNGQFRLSRRKAHIFSLIFTRLIRTLINTENGQALSCVPSHNYIFRQPRFTDTGYLRTVYDLDLPVKTEKVNNLILNVLSYVQSTWLRRKLKASVSAVKSWILLLYSKTLLEVLVWSWGFFRVNCLIPLRN